MFLTNCLFNPFTFTFFFVTVRVCPGCEAEATKRTSKWSSDAIISTQSVLQSTGRGQYCTQARARVYQCVFHRARAVHSLPSLPFRKRSVRAPAALLLIPLWDADIYALRLVHRTSHGVSCGILSCFLVSSPTKFLHCWDVRARACAPECSVNVRLIARAPANGLDARACVLNHFHPQWFY